MLVGEARTALFARPLEREVARDVEATPRTGLARTLARLVARSCGTVRPRRGVLRVLCGLLDAYNEELHRPEPLDDAGARRLAKTVLDAWRTIEGVRRAEGVADRILELAARVIADTGDHTIPEAVIFCRAVVGAGCVAGDVDVAMHRSLDRFAIALGAQMEAASGELSDAGWRGTLALLGVGEARDAGDLVRSALAALPAPVASELAAVVDTYGTPERAIARRRSTQYEPMVTRTVCATITPPSLGGFTARWRPALDEAMSELVRGPSSAFARATGYLQAQGGKRFRGLLALAAAGAAGGDPADALAAAAMVEWLHQSSLVLDDIVDEAQTRRGARCLHQLTSPLFTVATASWVLLRCGETAKAHSPAVVRALVDAELTLLQGECLELAQPPGAEDDISAYYRIVHGKTASLFSCAAAVGALSVPGVQRRAVDAVGRYGRHLGLAFQIVDDVLDYTGVEAEMGKQPGTDFRNGRLTLPLLLLTEATTIPADADFAWARRALAQHSIIERCLARAHSHVDQALAALAALPPGEHRDILEKLAGAIVERRA